MRISTRLALAALSLVFLMCGCATARTGARPSESLATEWEPALAGVYARMASAMVGPGEIYHPKISTVEQSGPTTFTTKTEMWIDVAGSRARGDVDAAFGGIEKQSSWIIEGPAYIQTLEYDPPYMREAATCRGSDDPLVSLLLACRAPGERGITTTLSKSDYHGEPAIVVLTQGATDEADGHTYFTETLFINLQTNLPIAIEGSGRAEKVDENGNITSITPIGRMVAFEHSFVAADSLDLAMFDPTTFGYQRRDPVASITRPSPDFTAYWLGEEPAFDDLPALEFADAYDVTGMNRPALRYRELATYRERGDEFGPTLLQLEEWRRDEWVAIEGEISQAWRDAPCIQRVTVDMDGDASATLYSGYGSGARRDDCPATPPTDYSAMVVLGETVIHVSAPAGSPYNSEEAIRAAIEALVPAN